MTSMKTNSNHIINYLRDTYTEPVLKGIVKSFKTCSLDTSNQTSLVNSETHVIDFDSLTKWFYKGQDSPKSADSLSFSEDEVHLFEFKSGQLISPPRKLCKLLSSVSGKIKDSGNTLTNKILSQVPECSTIKLNFHLVTSLQGKGYEPINNVYAKLVSEKSKHDSFKDTVEVRMREIDGSKRFSTTDLVYAEHFDEYLELHKIVDISL